MKIKEILPFTIDTPVIHLVQPSPAIPLGHEVVFRQSYADGGGVNPIYALAAQEKKVRRRRVDQSKKPLNVEEDTNLNCGFISPPIHAAVDQKKVKTSFYDLRNNNRSMSLAGESIPSLSPTLSSRTKSFDDSPKQERRKRSPDFEDILRELGCSSRTSDAGESTTSRVSSGESETGKHDVTRKCSVASSDSVFYDVSLDDPEVERSDTSPHVNITPRKSFSEETFDQKHTNIHKNRTRILETLKKNWRTASSDSCDDSYEEAWNSLKPKDKRRVTQMVDDLLLEIYGDKSTRPVRRRSVTGITRGRAEDSHYDSLYEDSTCCTEYTSGSEPPARFAYLQQRSVPELSQLVRSLQADVKRLGGRLVKQLVRRDCLLAKRDWHCNWITAYLQANSEKRSEDTKTRFSVAPAPGDSGFTQWQSGMRMVARLPEGIPAQFRKTLWLNLAEKHLASRGVQWPQVEEFCFNEFTNPDDEELGVQIVKDVHRTGCSLFCGVSGKDNQALLKRVLLAYARWNKVVGYCQGFNMLAALILQVMDKSEVDSVKVMIYLIEGVLPESYFANNLRGLSVDMAVFRDLLRIKLPTLSRHFDQLQCDSKDSGTSYEPPLTNVFTMQWFLTLFCNCLPQDTVLRVWDLIFLEGNHILLSTALAIWSTLSDRIMTVESADEFYCIMGVLTREMLEFGLMDANALIKAIVSFTLPELPELREKYLYNITPWTQSVSTVARRGLRLFYSDDDTDTEEDDEKIAIATAYGLFRSPKRKDGASGVTSPPRALTCPDKEKIAMDISALTKQYRKLRERQKQAHVILTAACGSQSLVGPTTSPAMNHLLMGKFALVNNKGRRLGPPPGSIPPPSQPRPRQGEHQQVTISGETLHWKDTMDGKKPQQRDSDEEQSPEQRSRRSSSSSTSTELCDDPLRSPSDSEDLSDASGLLPSDTEPSTPKRTLQPKVQHPSDVISCKEEDEEAFARAEEEKLSSQIALGVSQTESRTTCKSLSPASIKSSSPITPEGDDEKSQKRKLSFRIDPEELRQLDRKLSLKIVEIERRKSSAGIESEDLNSKVLFPFDRDYIHELEKCDRDTPSSIPDDIMCSTEDFISGFEEETIIVPDITTHKPLGFRMESLEECDETKINDSCEEIGGNDQDVRAAKEDSDGRLYLDNESPEELYEGEEDEGEDTQNAYSSYNFDELFIKKDTESFKYTLEQQEEMNNFQCCRLETNDTKINILPNINSSIKTEQTQETESSVNTLPGTSQVPCQIQSQDLIKNTSQNNTYLSDDMKAGISVSKSIKDDLDSTVENSQHILKNEHIESVELENPKSPSQTTLPLKDETLYLAPADRKIEALMTSSELPPASLNLSDSQKVLERKLSSVLPKMVSLSFDSNIPDIAAVASREACINSIREKYGHIVKTNNEENVPKNGGSTFISKDDSNKEMDSIKIEEKSATEFSDICTEEETKSKKYNNSLLNEDSKTESELPVLKEKQILKLSSDYIKDEQELTTYKHSLLLNIDSKIEPESKREFGENSDLKLTDVSCTGEMSSKPYVQLPLSIQDTETNLLNQEENGIPIFTNSVNICEGEESSEIKYFTVKNSNDKSIKETIEQPMNKTDEYNSSSNIHENHIKNMDEESNEEFVCNKKNNLLADESSKLLCNNDRETNPEIHSVEEESRRPLSATANRRGSEVALSLILQENLQILSKIQQQSRRSSEVNVDQTLDRFSKTEPSETETCVERRIKTEEEIISLTKSILEIDAGIGKSFSSGEKTPEFHCEKELVKPIFVSGYNIPEKQKSGVSLIEVLEKNASEEYNIKAEASVVENAAEKQEKNKESTIIEKSESLIDVDKLHTDQSKSPKHSISTSDKFQPYLSSKLRTDDLGSDTFSTEHTLKGFKDPYSYSKRPSIMSPTTEVDENSPPEINSSLKLKSSASIQEQVILCEPSHKFSMPPILNENADLLKIKPKTIDIDSLSDTNDDILKELRALDIRPEEVSEYSDPKVIPITPITPEDFGIQKTKVFTGEDTFDKEKYDFKRSSPNPVSEFRTSRHRYHDYKTTSFDVSSSDIESYSSERRRPIVRAATTVDNDDSLYLSSYKSHGKLLIEKGDLEPFRTLDTDKFSMTSGKSSDDLETRSCDRKPENTDEESAYDYRRVNSSRVNRSYSEFLADDSRSSDPTKTEPREKILFKYKSEDYGRSMSPPHYRFSSASPVRKRLDTLPTDFSPPYSTLVRAKSPSPTYYGSSHSLSSRDSSFLQSPERLGSSSDCKRYSRTESLDLTRLEIRSSYSKKRAESLDISTSDKLLGDKKLPLSPQKFNPFPVRSSSRQPKELGVKLGLYLPQKSDKSPSKHLT